MAFGNMGKIFLMNFDCFLVNLGVFLFGHHLIFFWPFLFLFLLSFHLFRNFSMTRSSTTWVFLNCMWQRAVFSTRRMFIFQDFQCWFTCSMCWRFKLTDFTWPNSSMCHCFGKA